jgi:hypothetical protein
MCCQSAVNMVVARFEQRRHVQDSGVVDKDIEATEVLQGAFDDRISAIRGHDAVAIRHRVAPCGDYLAGDITSGSEGLSEALHAAAEIIDDDLRAAATQLESVRPPETSPGASDDCYSAFECEAHDSSLWDGEPTAAGCMDGD